MQVTNKGIEGFIIPVSKLAFGVLTEHLRKGRASVHVGRCLSLQRMKKEVTAVVISLFLILWASI